LEGEEEEQDGIHNMSSSLSFQARIRVLLAESQADQLAEWMG
jgi:hypothetical protein